ncbi:MAG: type II secretion system F family protein, partial [Bacilli bacterium]|nr:type II secretion system F family protein [Bacilli bacterium]
MPIKVEPGILIVVGILLFLGLGVYLLISKFYGVFRLSRRLENYTIEPLAEHESSVGDSVYLVGLDMLERISGWLGKSEMVGEYSKRYEIYLTNKETSNFSLIEFIAKKMIWGILFLGFYFLLCGLRIYTPSILWTLFFFLVGFFLPDIYWESRRRKRMNQIEEDLLKSVTIMGNSFKAGKSIIQSLEIVSKELSGPLGEEFYRMHVDLKFGLELEMVLDRFYQRVPIEEVRYITTSLIILNRTGGNISDIFESIEANFLDQRKLTKELKSTTASASAISKILMFLPFFIVLLIR